MNEEKNLNNTNEEIVDAEVTEVKEENAEKIEAQEDEFVIPEIPSDAREPKVKKPFPYLIAAMVTACIALVMMIIVAALGASRFLYIIPALLGIAAWVLAFCSKKMTMVSMSAVTLAIVTVVASGTLLVSSSSRSVKSFSVSGRGDSEMQDFGRDFSPFDEEEGFDPFGDEDTDSDSDSRSNPFGSFGNEEGSSRPGRNSEDTQSGATEDTESGDADEQSEEKSNLDSDFSLKYPNGKKGSSESTEDAE